MAKKLSGFKKILDIVLKPEVFLTAVFLAAFLIRLLHVFAVWDIPPFSDSAEYHDYAAGLLQNHGFGDESNYTYRAPLYPFFLAIIYFLYGISFNTGHIAQAFLSSVTCLLIYLLGKKVFSKYSGYASAFISAFFSLYVFYSGWLLTETFYVFLMVCLALVLFTALERPTARNLCFSGILLGLTALTRAEALFTFVFIAPVFFINNGTKFLKGLREVLLISIVALAVILPWTARNFILTKEFIFISSQGGENLWMSANPKSVGRHVTLPEEITSKYQDPIQMDKELFKEGMDFIKQDPMRWLSLCQNKFNIYFQTWKDSEQWQFTDRFRFPDNIHPPLIPLQIIGLLGILGMVLAIPYIKKVLLLYAFLIANLFMQILLYVEPRLHVQVTPFLIIFAGAPIFVIEQLIKSRNKKDDINVEQLLGQI